VQSLGRVGVAELDHRAVPGEQVLGGQRRRVVHLEPAAEIGEELVLESQQQARAGAPRGSDLLLVSENLRDLGGARPRIATLAGDHREVGLSRVPERDDREPVLQSGGPQRRPQFVDQVHARESLNIQKPLCIAKRTGDATSSAPDGDRTRTDGLKGRRSSGDG